MASVLAAIALPSGLAEAVDAALAAYETGRGRRERTASLGSIEARKSRLRDMYELGDLPRDDYLRRRDELDREAEDRRGVQEPTFLRQRTALRSLVDDWDKLGPDQRKRLLSSVFEEIVVGAEAFRSSFRARGGVPTSRPRSIVRGY